MARHFKNPNPPRRYARPDPLAVVVAQHQAGRFAEAEAGYQRLLMERPASADAWHLWGVLATQQKRYEAAVARIQRALELKPQDSVLLHSLGNAFLQQGQLARAIAACQEALRLRPELIGAHLTLGRSYRAQGRLPDAETAYRRALELRPDYAEVHYDLGGLLGEAKRLDEAEAAFRKAIELRPEYVEAHNDLGILLRNASRWGDAEAAFRKTLELCPDSPVGYSNLGTVLRLTRRFAEAEATYCKALELRPDSPEVHNNLGILLLDVRRLDEAEAACRKALALRPHYPEAHNTLGLVLKDAGRFGEADAAYRKAVELRPDSPEIQTNLGNLLDTRNRQSEALVCFKQVLALEPRYPNAPGRAADCQAKMCDWVDHTQTQQDLLRSIWQGHTCVMPFEFLHLCDDPLAQRQCAEIRARDQYSGGPGRGSQIPHYSHDRIRLAYVSPDFREHPVAYLMADLIERHDRSHFEVFGISIGPDARDPWRQRLAKGFDRFLDVRGESDEAVVQRLRSLEIDIAVDLAGYTTHARTEIFAGRVAPIQVNYLGFPGTMGAEFIDYILADRFVIPDEQELCYTEKVVHLPDTFQCASLRTIPENTPTREELQLPAAGFVFCCFNNTYKIHPEFFHVWMRLLTEVEESVLWLVSANESVEDNLRREAKARGVDPDRLVFAPRVPFARHLARQRQADLFLDTLPYNAGTTASDALWVGLPVLTCSGRSFASRMGSSLLRAIGLPELIADNLADYEAAALRLASRPDDLAEVRQRLEMNRRTWPLFDVDRFRRHIEAAYRGMWENWQRDESPTSFSVDAIAAGTNSAPAASRLKFR